MSINGSADHDPWSRLGHSSNTSPILNHTGTNTNNASTNMDSELASIVSSLSALSNGNVQHQHQQAHTQLGGYRRSSVSASSNNQEIDIDIEAIYANNVHQQSKATQNRAALSVGTAPPYAKHGQQGDPNIRLFNNHYSASIAGPIMFTNGSSTGTTNGAGGVGGGGFFEKFGKSLIEGTRELENLSNEDKAADMGRRESINSDTSDHHKNIWNVAQAPVFKPNQDNYSQFPLPLSSQFIDQQHPFMYVSNDVYPHQPPVAPQQQHQPQGQHQSQHQNPHQNPHKYQHQEPKRTHKASKKQQSNPYLDTSPASAKISPSRISSPTPKQSTIATRSPLLEEFRSNSNSEDKVYTLNDIIGYVLEFCKDQHGSRFIQHELSNASNSEREVIFNEIRDFAIELSDDVFGNYVIQKFFEFGSNTQKDILVNQFKGKMKFLSMKMYSCRVIQKSLEFIDLQQRIDLVTELSKCVLQMIKDQNGNHVIQKAIERIPLNDLPFILNSLTGQIYHLSTHSYGCRVIQRLLEFGKRDDQSKILTELNDFIPYLIQDQYGNYVIQHILQQNFKNSFDEMIKIKQKIIEIVSKNVVEFSKHKFASNVVEKSILFGSVEQKKLIVSKILPVDENHALELNDTSPLILMMKDQFANYVVQKLVGVSKGNDQKLIVIAIRSYLDKLNKSDSMGNRHLASVEKLASLVENVKI